MKRKNTTCLKSDRVGPDKVKTGCNRQASACSAAQSAMGDPDNQGKPSFSIECIASYLSVADAW